MSKDFAVTVYNALCSALQKHIPENTVSRYASEDNFVIYFNQHTKNILLNALFHNALNLAFLPEQDGASVLLIIRSKSKQKFDEPILPSYLRPKDFENTIVEFELPTENSTYTQCNAFYSGIIKYISETINFDFETLNHNVKTEMVRQGYIEGIWPEFFDDVEIPDFSVDTAKSFYRPR